MTRTNEAASVPQGMTDRVRARLQFEVAGYMRSTNPLDREAGIALTALLAQAAPPAAPARSISDEMMDLADRLGSQAGEVDPRAWKHLLVYAPPVQGDARELLQAVLDHDARICRALITQKIRTPDDASHQAAKQDQKSWDVVADRIRALLAAPAASAQQDEREAPYMPLTGAMRLVREKLARFEECAGDDEGCDIGRDWFDALTTIGLLARTQRSPAMWSMTPAGEAMLAQQVQAGAGAVDDSWKPIETAPKDGTHIILRWGSDSMVGWWLDNTNTRTPWAGWRVPSLQTVPFGQKPTHWMPIPPAPIATLSREKPQGDSNG